MSNVELVLWAGFAIGLAFGAAGQITGFCLHRGLQEHWGKAEGYKLQAFALALAVALLGTHLLVLAGWVDIGRSLYMAPAFSWLLLPLGGLMFGYGMVLANGCGARALVLLGQGNLRSLMVLMCLGVAAYMALTGVIAPLRLRLSELSLLSPSGIAVPDGMPRHIVVAALVLALAGFAVRKGGWRHGRADLAGGAVIGGLVVAGWWATGRLGADEFDPVPLASLTFVAPIGETIQYAMIATGASLSFGVAIVLGVLAGSALAAALRGQYRLQGFDSPRQMLRYLSGGAMMGIGGALALGCSIGQGLTGLTTLAYGSMIASAAIVAGARLATFRASHPST
ncbi:MAG: YeeE/YedE family protein [Alcaligenaceae bacterium]|nr:YeeE/YedE family protein [Alcaligenaceae bacterium]